MHRGLTIDELGDLLVLPLVAVLATRWEDGRVLLSPVWHEYREGAFNVCSSSADIKVRHLQRDPRAEFLLCESVPPYRGVQLTANGEVTTNGSHDILTRIATRYLGDVVGRAYVKAATDDVVIRLEPGIVRAWDFADDFS